MAGRRPARRIFPYLRWAASMPPSVAWIKDALAAYRQAPIDQSGARSRVTTGRTSLEAAVEPIARRRELGLPTDPAPKGERRACRVPLRRRVACFRGRRFAGSRGRAVGSVSTFRSGRMKRRHTIPRDQWSRPLGGVMGRPRICPPTQIPPAAGRAGSPNRSLDRRPGPAPRPDE